MSLSLSLILIRTQHEHSHKDITKKTKAYAGTFRSASITAKTHKQACCAVANSASDRRRTATQRQQQPWWLWRVGRHNKLKKQSKGKKARGKKKTNSELTNGLRRNTKSRGRTVVWRLSERTRSSLKDGRMQEAAQFNIRFFYATYIRQL